MFKKQLWVLLIFPLFLILGCADGDNDEVWPVPRPLGQEIQTYRPPVKPYKSVPVREEITEPNDVITLREALALSLMHNPELKSFSWQVRASEARTLQASLLPNPEIEVEVEEVGGTGGRSGFDASETTIQLGQLIELGGKVEKREKVASLESELAGWGYEAKRVDVLTKVTHAFVEVLASQERLKLADELVQLSEEILYTVSLRVEAGKDSPVEKTKAQLVLSGARVEQKQAVQRLKTARKRLTALWGNTSPVFEEAAGQFELVSGFPSESKLSSFLVGNPELARWAVEMERQRAILELEKANSIIDPRLSGGVQYLNEDNDTAIVFGVSVPVPIFNQNQGKILEARYNILKARNQQEAAEASLNLGLSEAYQGLSIAFIQATDLKEEILPGAQSAMDATREGYSQGKFDYLMVLDAQRTFFLSRAKYVESLAAYHRARADIEQLVGQSIEELNRYFNENIKEQN
ncbi:MAG: TolC family protein [Planctomycetota bacterium]|jgi:cobalt-zinc-cadmium efflux system outer membrane protein